MNRNKRLIAYDIPPLRFVGRPVGKTSRGAEILSGLLKFAGRIRSGRVYVVRRPLGIGYLRLFAVLDGPRARSKVSDENLDTQKQNQTGNLGVQMVTI